MPPHGPHCLSGILSTIWCQMKGGGEADGHAAAAAFVGLFPTVHDVVLDQVGMVVEGLVVLGAHVRAPPRCVCAGAA